MGKTWAWALLGSVLNFNQQWAISVCNHCGVNALEYNERGVKGLSEERLVERRDKYASAGISINSFHLPFSQNDDIASFYESKRLVAVDNMIRTIKIAGLLGAKVVIQHPTTNSDPAEANGLQTYFDQLEKSLQKLLPVARDAGVVIGLENMTPGQHGGRFCSQPDHFDYISDKFNDPNLGFIYDTGHALLSMGDRAHEILEAMGNGVVGWHLADNPGDRDAHLAPGRGEVDWQGVFQYADRIGFSGPMTMETAPWGAGPDYSMDTWKKSIDMLNALANEAISKETC